MTFILTAALVGLVLILLASVRIAQEYERGVVFRLGRHVGMRGPGLYLLIPLVERQVLIDQRTNTVSVERQETVTKDSVAIQVNAVLWYRIVDPSRAVLNVADYRNAVYQIALTSLRNIIGQHLLDEVLKERNAINAKLAEIVDTATESWGVKVDLVEMKDVELPQTMQRALAREAEAMRERRARLIKAEAEQEASLRLAEAAKVIAANPVALELRRLQTVSEVGAEHNTTTVVLLPSDFVNAASAFAQRTGSAANAAT